MFNFMDLFMQKKFHLTNRRKKLFIRIVRFLEISQRKKLFVLFKVSYSKNPIQIFVQSFVIEAQHSIWSDSVVMGKWRLTTSK